MSNPIENVGVVGAGLMGTGIAESIARAGFTVTVHEPDEAPLARSRKHIQASVDKAIAGGKLSEEEGSALIDRVTWSDSIDSLSGAQLVIEAVFEDPAVKGPLFAQLDAMLPPDVILASNTSSIAIAQIASSTENPGRVIGLHFFSPVPVMKLVEVVVGLESAEESVARGEEFVAAIGKQSIRTKDRSGFVVNALLVPYLLGAIRMFEEGFATREDIDNGMVLGAGYPMGPLALCDLVGLDVLYGATESLYEEFKRADYAPPPLLKRMVAAGHHGRKTGRGFYEYPSKARS